jgi:phosphosulfolactate synthase
MNFSLNNLPERTSKPREKGLTMAMDKGLSLREAEDFVSVASAYTDIVKLGWSTSMFTPNLKEKIAVYQNAGLSVYFGGTLFEAFIIRNQFDDYLNLIRGLDQDSIETVVRILSRIHAYRNNKTIVRYLDYNNNNYHFQLYF